MLQDMLDKIVLNSTCRLLSFKKRHDTTGYLRQTGPASKTEHVRGFR